MLGLHEQLPQQEHVRVRLMTQLAVDLLFGHVPQLLDDVVHLVNGERALVLEARVLDVFVRGLDGAQTEAALGARESHEANDARLMVIFYVQIRLENDSQFKI